MRFYYLAYCFMLILLVSCSHSSSHRKITPTKIEKKPFPYQKPSSSFNDTLKINSPAAVFYHPDSMQLEKIKLTTDAQIFDGTMHEYFYLIKNAHDVPKKILSQSKNHRYTKCQVPFFRKSR